MTAIRADVCVVGGGPAGSAVAWALARNGLDVVVLDKATFPRRKPCAEYLSPQAARLLDELGVLERLEASGATTLAGMRIVAGEAEFTGRFSSSLGFHPYRERGLAVRRERLDAMLLDAARHAGACVVESATVGEILREGDGRVSGVRARIGADAAARGHQQASARARGDALEVRTAHVVGADGLRSVVSRRLGLAHRLRWPRRFAFATHFAGVSGLADVGEMYVYADGYCGLAPVGDGLANVAVVVTDARAAGGDPAAFVDRWIAAHGALAVRFAGAARASDVLVTGPFASQARRAWAPGASLVGDAADFFDPFTGEGIYAALRGAELLAPYVVDAVAATRGGHPARAAAALAAYDRCRRHEFGGKWRLERLIALAVAHPPLMAFAARRLAQRGDLADLLVGVTGDFVPAPRVLNLRYALELFGAREAA
jgi:flavin-dependent dehydrogenase